jgi:hypothetical protein
MATGLSTQLTGKIGEHLVTAELARRGIMASPFSGNVPDIDILGYANRVAAPIQVKTISSDSWQFNINKFLNIKSSDKGQKISGINEKLDRRLVCIFVALGEALGDAQFYVLKFGWLQDYFLKHYKGRKPPKNVDSYHCAIWKKDMGLHLGKWSIVENRFGIKK